MVSCLPCPWEVRACLLVNLNFSFNWELYFGVFPTSSLSKKLCHHPEYLTPPLLGTLALLGAYVC